MLMHRVEDSCDPGSSFSIPVFRRRSMWDSRARRTARVFSSSSVTGAARASIRLCSGRRCNRPMKRGWYTICARSSRNRRATV